MGYIKPIDRCSKTIERINYALGNTIEIINILKEVTLSDSIDLLFYDKDRNVFYDKIKKNTISVNFLEDNISILGQAYISKTPYYSSHILYDKYYNISIDNPFKTPLSMQIIVPILDGESIIGMIRFSKSKYTFDKWVSNSLSMLQSSFLDMFSPDIDKKADTINDTFFSIDKDKVYDIMDTLSITTKKLSINTYNPEILKLLTNITENIESISNYIQFDSGKLSQEPQPQKIAKTNDIHILIADDVQMNVKILHAMIKTEPSLEISFAYDGIETLEVIEESKRKQKGVDVLFLDHYMPGKLGLEVAKTIREYENSDTSSKIIIVSITNDPSAIEKHRSIYDYHLPKPFVKSDIVSVLDSIKTSFSYT